MTKFIDIDSVIQDGQVWSRDLKEYVVPVKTLQQAPFIQQEDLREKSETQEELLRVLFNRCFALTGPTMCSFCGIKESCDKNRSVGRNG